MKLDHRDIIELTREGGKLLPKGKPVLTPAPVITSKPSGFFQLVGSIKNLSDALLALAKKPQAETVVNVSSPQVSVRPEFKLPSNKKWKCTITKRDVRGELEEFEMEAVDK